MNVKKWKNFGGCINIIEDIKFPDIPDLIAEKDIHSIQFNDFKNPSHHTWGTLNKFFELYPHIGLIIQWCDPINFNFIDNIPNLEILSVKSFLTNDYSSLTLLKRLQSLHIGETKSVAVDLDFIQHLQNLRIVSLNGMKKRLESISNLTKLWSLNLRGIKSEKLDWISNLNSLELLKLMYGSFKNLDGVGNLNNLKYLGISRVKQIPNYQFLNQLKSLEFLHFEGMTEIINIPDLSGLPNLKKLQLQDLNNLEEISSISQASNLEEFIIYFSDKFSCVTRKKIVNHALRIMLKLDNLKKTNLLDLEEHPENLELKKKGVSLYDRRDSKWTQDSEGGWTL